MRRLIEREIAPKDGKANSGAFKAVKEKVFETGRKVGLK
jgi:general stress protein YciG